LQKLVEKTKGILGVKTIDPPVASPKLALQNLGRALEESFAF
jgi:hypothetical protein